MFQLYKILELYTCIHTSILFFSCLVDCHDPGTPANGNSDFNSTVLNATVVHLCDAGYVLCNGNETRVCQSDMMWSGMLPDCISKFTIHFNLHN